jgi:HlyD family secretion protein
MGKTAKRIAWGTLAAGMIGLLVYAFRSPPVDVDVAVVTRGPLRVSIDREGKTRIRERFVVSSPLAGHLQRIRLRAGDTVTANYTDLASIEPADPAFLDARAKSEAEARVRATDAARQRADAALARARQTHAFARAKVERLRLLRGTAAASEDEFDAADNREREAAEDVRGAQFATRVSTFEYELAKAALIRIQPKAGETADTERFVIKAPVDGRVLRVFQESAAVVPAGTKLIELGDPTDLEMEIDVLSADAVKIPLGAKVIVEHWGGSAALLGRVRIVEPSAFLKVSALGVEEQRVNVIADFVDPPDRRPTLGDAYRVEASVVIWESDGVLKAPAGALFRRGNEWAAFAVRDGRARIAVVDIGHSNGLETEILGGVSEGDSIILHPSDRVVDGVRITPR